MRLTVLGSGTCSPRLERNASGLALEADEKLIVIDMGPGTIRRMCEAGIDARRVDIILLTHFHPDHVADVAPFLFASNYGFGSVREEPFHLIGPQGLEQYFSGLVGLYQDWIKPRGDRLIKRELSADRMDMIELDGCAIRSTPAKHTQPALSYRIEADGKALTVSGDTDVSEGLVELAEGSDLMVCECSMPDEMKVSGHLTPSEAGEIARRSGVGALVLTHFYPPCDEVDVAAAAAARFKGPVFKAQDLMVLTI